MSSTTSPLTSAPSGIFATRSLLILWLCSGLALALCVGLPPVQRTQEARVLETARQLRGTGWRGWLVPRINGTLRLQKPPLTYWIAALAYDIAGVGNTSGRMPSVISGWLTIGVTFAAGRQIFGQRAGLVAAACLLSSYLFFRHNRLAETDSPSAMFATLAIFMWWRAVESGECGSALLFHIGAFGTAMAVMFKGGPGAYPPIFLLGFVALRGRWSALWRFVRCGAPITLLALAAPWFIYAQRQTRTEQFAGEVDTLFSGQDHGATFYRYFPELVKATAPWSLVALAAFGFAIAPLVWHLFSRTTGSFVACFAQWRMTPRAGVIVWAAAIFLPLCVIGNKQFHYLLPLMPPVMLLVGWLLDRAMRGPTEEIPIVVYAPIDLTMLGTLLAAPAVLLVSRQMHPIRTVDWMAGATVGLTGITVIVLYLWRGRPAALAAYLVAVFLFFPPMIGLWVPTLEPHESADVAREIHQRYGNGPYVFYGANYSLPLCFNLRCAIPSAHSPAQLIERATNVPHLVVIAQKKSGIAPPPVPQGFVGELTLKAPGQTFDIYRSALSTTFPTTHNSSPSESR